MLCTEFLNFSILETMSDIIDFIERKYAIRFSFRRGDKKSITPLDYIIGKLL